MSLFVNMTKTLGAYISRALESAKLATKAQNSNITSGFAKWRASYDRFSNHKEKLKVNMNRLVENKRCVEPDESVLSGLKRRRLALRLLTDKKGLNKASVPAGMRVARMLRINARQDLPSMPSICQQPIRMKCGRENCADPCYWPVCPPGNQRFVPETNKLFNIYEAYWDDKNDACCIDECKWALPRFDDIYFRESDKSTRMYQRTWHECPELIKPKRVCCYESYDCKPIEYCKRPKKERPPTACPPVNCNLVKGKCPKFVDERCCTARVKKCKPLVKGLTDCRKFCAPYPAFSECARAKIRPKHPIECKCLRQPSMCEFWHYWRHRYANRTENCA